MPSKKREAGPPSPPRALSPHWFLKASPVSDSSPDPQPAKTQKKNEERIVNFQRPIGQR